MFILFHHLGAGCDCVNMTTECIRKERYAAPEIEVVNIHVEGVLCGSPLKPGESEDGELGDDL